MPTVAELFPLAHQLSPDDRVKLANDLLASVNEEQEYEIFDVELETRRTQAEEDPSIMLTREQFDDELARLRNEG